LHITAAAAAVVMCIGDAGRVPPVSVTARCDTRRAQAWSQLTGGTIITRAPTQRTATVLHYLTNTDHVGGPPSVLKLTLNFLPRLHEEAYNEAKMKQTYSKYTCTTCVL